MTEERLVVVAAENACGFDGEVSVHFGRCPFLALAEVRGRTATISQVVPNPHLDTHRSDMLPRFVHELGADVIIAGGMEPPTIDMFHDFGIDVATGVTGTVHEVLGAYLCGKHRGVAPGSPHD